MAGCVSAVTSHRSSVLLLVHFSAPAAAPHLLRLRALLTPALLPPPLPVVQGSVEG